MAPKKRGTPVEEERPSSPAGRLTSALRKEFKDDVFLGASHLDSEPKTYISTRIATLDYAIRAPGVPSGHASIFIGKEGGGKSSVLYHVMAECQSRGGIAMLIDAERRFMPDRAAKMDVDLDELIVVTAHTAEKVFTIVEETVKDMAAHAPNTPMIIGIDSLSGLVSEKALEKELGEASVGLVARVTSSAFPRFVDDLAKTQVALIVVNQLRAYIDMSNGRNKERRKVMKEKSMVAEATLVYYGSLILYFTSTGLLGERDDPTGISVRAEVRKSSIGPGEGHQGEFDIGFLRGANLLKAKLDLLETLGVIEQSGGWYNFEGMEKKFRLADFAGVLEAHPELDTIVKEAPTLWKT